MRTILRYIHTYLLWFHVRIPCSLLDSPREDDVNVLRDVALMEQCFARLEDAMSDISTQTIPILDRQVPTIQETDISFDIKLWRCIGRVVGAMAMDLPY